VRLASVIVDGARKAAIIDGDEAFVTDIPGLEVAIAGSYELGRCSGKRHPLRNILLDVPIRPPVLLCTGSNYRDHVEERALSAEAVNTSSRDMEFFLKAGQTIAELGSALRLSTGIGTKIDQETEVGLVMGRDCPRGVTPKEAMDYVFGFIVANDVTARDKQVRIMRDGTIVMALGASKNFDSATRLGSSIVTKEEIPDIAALAVRTFVNGELTQNNSTANLIHSFGEIISFFSTGLTLEAGCIILTGTPGGTGWGQDSELGGNGFVPPQCKRARYLRSGDEIRSEVSHVGSLTFNVE